MAPASGIRAGAAYVEIIAEISGLERGLRQAQQKLTAFGAAVRDVGTTFMAAGAAITAPFVAASKIFVSTGDQLDKMSRRTGFSVETLSALSYAADLSGASLEDVGTGIKFLQKNLSDAALGGKEANEAFARLGIRFSDLQAMSPEEQFAAVTKSLGEIQDPAARTELAMRLLGRSGTTLLPMTQDMAALRAEAQRLGLVMSTQDAKAAAELGDDLDRVWATVRMLAISVGSALMPVLTQWANWVREATAGATQWAREHQRLVQIALGMGMALTFAGAGIYALGLALSGFGGAVKLVSNLSKGVWGLVKAITALAGVSLPATLLRFSTGIATAAKALQTLTAAMKAMSIGALASQLLGWVGSWGALTAAISIATKAIGAFIVAAAPLAGAVALIAGAAVLVGYNIKLIADIRSANKVIAETRQQISALNQQLLQMDKASGGGKDMTFARAAENIDEYIQALIKAGKTREQIIQMLQQRRDAEAVRKEATSKEWTSKNAFSHDVYAGMQNESARMTEAFDRALSENLITYSKMFDDVAAENRRLTQQMAVEEAKRTGQLQKAIQDRSKALKDFQGWLAEQQGQKSRQEAAEGNRELARSDPLSAVKQASDAYAASLQDANNKVAAAQKLLADALASPESDVRRNERGEIEIVNNEEVQSAVAAAKEAYRIAEDQKQLLQDATRAAIEAQDRATDEAQTFEKRYTEVQERRTESGEQRQFDEQLKAAKGSPEAAQALEAQTESRLAEAIRQAKDLKAETEAAFARARQSGTKADVEKAKAGAEETLSAESRVDALRDRLLKIGEQMDLAGTVSQRFDVSGTFGAQAAFGMGVGGSAVERTAKASEETAKNTKRIIQKMENEGLSFE